MDRPEIFMDYNFLPVIENGTKDGPEFLRRVDQHEVLIEFLNDVDADAFHKWWRREGIYGFSEFIQNRVKENDRSRKTESN